jgi:hypothetical protein
MPLLLFLTIKDREKFEITTRKEIIKFTLNDLALKRPEQFMVKSILGRIDVSFCQQADKERE